MRTKATGIILFLFAATGSASAQDPDALAEEGKDLMQRFGGALKAELSAAMQSGGPVEAIAVCHERAPAIAEEIAGESGWSVARSSHRVRNPSNEPDAYTAAVIEDFLTREAAGESAADLLRAEVVEENDAVAFRMVKAIPTDEVCLACHGGAIVAPETEAKLAELYPKDMARGFEAGQMRGVFTLRKPMDE